MGNPWHTSTGRGTGPGLVNAYEEAKTADVPRLMDLIDGHHLSWEMVPTEKLDNKGVWRALAQDMPITALIRNLATLTRVGAVTPMDAGWLVNALFHKMTANQRAIHPINVLSALLTYRSGRSVRGSNSWGPIPRISSALMRSFTVPLTSPHRLIRGSTSAWTSPAPCHTIQLPVFLA